MFGKLKNSFIFLLTLLLFVGAVSSSVEAAPPKYPSSSGTSRSIAKGDILFTNDTISSGLTGHVGIVISYDEVVHIEGMGKNPESISIKKWFKRYPNTTVIRYDKYSRAKKAARWAEDYAAGKGKRAEYKITGNLKTTDKTYCSKLVWQAFYYGADVTIIDPYDPRVVNGGLKNRIILPREFKVAHDTEILD